MRGWAVAVVVSTGLGAVACGPGQAAVRRERALQERVRLEAQLDRLEERLLANQARVRAWSDLKARHAEVSQVACQNAEWHAQDMARAAKEELAFARAARGPRLAAVGMGGGGPTVGP